jgi:hypothetical protein
MNNFGGNIYANPLLGIDTSRSSVNKIMNPVIQDYAVSEKKTEEQETARDSRSLGADGIAGTTRTHDSSSLAESKRTTGSAGKNKVSVSARQPDTANTNDSGFKFEFTSENMMNGIILSELLGKPKILQKRRW